MTTKITEQNISNISNAAVQWQTTVTADGSTATTAVAGYGYFIDTTSAAHTVNLPNTASVGDTIILKDYAGTWGSNNVTISSTLKISGADADGTLSTNNTTITVVYMDTTKGWTPIQNSTQGALASDTSYITATGGTVSTSGDFKIHTFTGDGCFVVSCAGTGTAEGTDVDYLVVAGGGGGGSDGAGAGGAGGFREGYSSPFSPYTASPLVACSGITVSATTYPITVGSGGAGHPGPAGASGSVGSDSVFSTITSSGGGLGGRSPSTGGAGGSGGGSRGCASPGGTGNTPPVSPPQGQPGGTNPTGTPGSSGGGGATTAGTGGAEPQAGPGGAGGTTNISASPTTYAGGGGGGNDQTGNGGVGGSGGGGNGSKRCSAVGTAGSANTGGGGGGGGVNPPAGYAGGKGIVIIRYRFQA